MKTASKFSFVAAAFATAAILAGCSGKSGEGRNTVTVKGSDTMVHLVSTWAEAFMKAHPDVEISVTGGGSGTGIAALINGTTDICASSRNIKDSERAQAQQKGISATETAVARDGIALVVNPANPVQTVSIDQLRKIYTGAYTRWNQLGGPAEGIIALSRESSSGTYVFFQEHVLNKEDYAQSVQLMPATSSIIQSVMFDRWSVGYVGIGFAHEAGRKVKILGVKASDTTSAVIPSEATVRSGEYSIARPLFFYTKGTPTGAVKEFTDFCLSDEGQRIVRETGYVSVQ